MEPVDTLDAEALEAEIAALSARMDAAMHRMLTLVRRFDETGEWARQGHKTCAAWLSWRTGLGPGSAREHVRVAKALAELPLIEDALRRGELSYAKVRALTRVVTPEREENMLHIALHATAQQLERICRNTRQVQQEEARYFGGTIEAPNRDLWTLPMPDGTVQIVAQLHADEAALVLRAVDAVRKERADEQRVETPAECAGRHPTDGEPDARAEGGVRQNVVGTPRRAWPNRADALVHLAERTLAGADAISGGDLCTIEVRFGRDALNEGRFCAELDDGTHVPAETFRRLACDAGLVPVIEGEDGQTLDVGRKTRRIPPAIRRALRSRQPTCAFPGCGHRRHLDAHHVVHWIDGGSTKLENLVHLCRVHHRLVHEDGFCVELGESGEPFFRTLDGMYIAQVPTRSRGNVDDARFDDVGTQLGIPIAPDVNLPRWDRRRPDYRECVRAVLPG